MPASIAFTLISLGLAVITATCARMCFRVLAKTVRQQPQAQVAAVERESGR